MLYDVLAIFIPLGIMILLIWKRVNIVIAAPICTALMAFMSNLDINDAMTVAYMKAFGNYTINYFPLILLGGVFSKFMESSGASRDVAELLAEKLGADHAMLIVIMTSLILTYGGVSFFVVVFAVYPIALPLWKKADLPRSLIPGAISAGAFTAPNLGPGSPGIINVLPMKYLGTTATSAPLLGTIDALVIFGLSTFYMLAMAKRAKKKGEHFVADAKVQKIMEEAEKREPGNGWVALIPLILVVGLIVAGVNVLLSLLAGILVIFLIYRKAIIETLLENFNGGVSDAIVAITNTSAVVGFGGVAALTAGYQALINFVIGMAGPPLLSFGIGTAILAGASGSGSGGLGLAMELLAPKYLEMGVAAEALHKVASAACITLDSLPHNGVMVTLLTVCGVTHKEGYKHIFMNTVVFALIAMFVSIILGTIMYPIG